MGGGGIGGGASSKKIQLYTERVVYLLRKKGGGQRYENDNPKYGSLDLIKVCYRVNMIEIICFLPVYIILHL